MAQLVEAGAHHLRLAAQAVGVLHAVVAFQVRAADRAALEQGAVVARHVDLTRLAAQRVDARVEGAVAAARRVDRQRADDQRRLEHRLEGEEGVQRERGRDLRAVDQRQAFLGRQRERRDAGRAQRRVGRHALAVLPELALADQRQRQVGERRQVARGADRALRRDPRHEAGVEHRQQRVDHLLAHARAPRARLPALSASISARPARQRRADADAVRADQVELQPVELVGRDARAGELAEAGVDAVDRPLAGGGARDDAAPARRPGRAPGRARGAAAAAWIACSCSSVSRPAPAQHGREPPRSSAAPPSIGSFRPCSRAQRRRLVAGVGVAHHAGAGSFHSTRSMRCAAARCRRRR
jgi:hypothetical protein